MARAWARAKAKGNTGSFQMLLRCRDCVWNSRHRHSAPREPRSIGIAGPAFLFSATLRSQPSKPRLVLLSTPLLPPTRSGSVLAPEPTTAVIRLRAPFSSSVVCVPIRIRRLEGSCVVWRWWAHRRPVPPCPVYLGVARRRSVQSGRFLRCPSHALRESALHRSRPTTPSAA